MKKELIIGPVVVVVVWWLLTATGLVKPLFLASPLEVTSSLWYQSVDGSLFADIWATVARLVVGFLLAVALGIPTGLLLGASSRLYSAVEIPLDFFRSLPAMAVFPLFLLAFGLGDPAKIAITTWSGALIIVINTMYGVRTAKVGRQAAAKVFGASRYQVFMKVILPDALPQIVAGLRISVSLCLIVVIVSEMFMGTKAGIGMSIYNAGLLYDTPKMLAGIMVAGLVGYLLNKAFAVAERRIVHWSGH